MHKFQIGEEAVMKLQNGAEMVVYLIDEEPNDMVHVRSKETDRFYGVQRSQLLRVKAPFFDVRGLVFTASQLHPGEQGEIVAVGQSASEKQAFQVSFGSGKTEWFTADQVFIEAAHVKPRKSIKDVL